MLCLFLVRDCSLHPPSPSWALFHMSTIAWGGEKHSTSMMGLARFKLLLDCGEVWFSVGPSATWGFTGSAALAPTNTSPAGSNDKLHLSSSFAQHLQCPPRVILWTHSHALSKHCCPKGHHKDRTGMDLTGICFFPLPKFVVLLQDLGKCCPLIEGFYKWNWVCARFNFG